MSSLERARKVRQLREMKKMEFEIQGNGLHKGFGNFRIVVIYKERAFDCWFLLFFQGKGDS